MIPPVIDVDLDLELLPRDLVAGLAQSSAFGRRPQCLELFAAQSDFTFFPAWSASAANFERERHDLALLSQKNVTPAWFIHQITLAQWTVSRMQDLHWQPLDQEFAFNLAAFFVFHRKCCQPCVE